jgi:hypothetical protein
MAYLRAYAPHEAYGRVARQKGGDALNSRIHYCNIRFFWRYSYPEGTARFLTGIEDSRGQVKNSFKLLAVSFQPKN